MKTYSIGRETSCDIVINDSTDVISRRHALLNVAPSGKMTVIDQSSNGTYVNGIRISPNVPVPVTRRDTISFAHVAKLDWRLIPKTNQWIKYAIIGGAAIVVIIAAIFIFKACSNSSNEDDYPYYNDAVTDTIAHDKEVVDKAKSNDKAKTDSIAKIAKRDSNRKDANKVKKEAQPSTKSDKPKETQPQQTNPDNNTPDTPSESKKANRALG